MGVWEIFPVLHQSITPLISVLLWNSVFLCSSQKLINIKIPRHYLVLLRDMIVLWVTKLNKSSDCQGERI